MKLSFRIIAVVLAIYMSINIQAQNSSDPDQMIVDAKAALELNPQDSMAYQTLGVAYYQKEDFAKAKKFLDKSKELNNNSFIRHLFSARTEGSLSEKESAIESLSSLAGMGFRNYTVFDEKAFNSVRNHPSFDSLRQVVYNNVYPCRNNTDYRRFDFWIGEWDVYVGGQKIADSYITLSNDDCAVLENYQPTNFNPGGNSITYYDATDGKWKQNWVAGGGVSHYVEPDSKSHGDLQFISKQPNFDLKMTFTAEENGSVTQEILFSSDGGATWQPSFLGVYKKKEGH